MIYKPYDYQKYATDRIIAQPRVGLFLDMGLGKTVITLSAIKELIFNRFQVFKALIIAPLRVAQSTWPAEVEKWTHLKGLRVVKILGNKEQRLRALETDGDIYVINRENVPWLCDVFGKNWNFDMVVIDELSSFKSPHSARFKALKKQMPKVSRVVGLTGTPTPNGLLDLWSQIFLLDQGERLQKKLQWYRYLYFEPDKRSAQQIFTYKPKPGAEQRILDRLSDLCVSMSAKDYLELPERTDRVTELTLPPELMKKYENFERDSFLKIADSPEGITALSAAGLINKLLQFSNGAVYFDDGTADPLINRGHSWEEIHSLKLDVLSEICECGQPVLCFYSYKSDFARIKERFPEARTLETPEDVVAWNRGEIPLLLCHPASAGHGLNLQSGGHIIAWFGLPWSLELYQQANARLHRQGQNQPVIVHHIVCKGTADEKVMNALGMKRDTQSAVIDFLRAKFLYKKALGRE